ncbi:hypothetical protein AB0L28_34200 [Streptomyces sp. NPDC052503]|uniref:hypothetical protein n=1 Tax=Streptomyces sp. NPDC052503 TaxID=3156683 RepID=UPI00341D5E7C
MSKRKRIGTSAAAARVVAGAVRRAPKSLKVGKELKGFKPPADFVEMSPLTRRNVQRTGQDLKGVHARSVYKSGKIVSTGQFVKISRDQQHKRPALTDRVFRPMTRTQAAAVSEAMRDPNLPTRKLSPRP